MALYDVADIFYAKITDPEGNGIPGKHPSIILAKLNATHYLVMGITGSFFEPIGPLLYKMRWATPYHIDTGLSKPCVAKAYWREIIHESQFGDYLGSASPEEMNAVIDRMNLHIANPQLKQDRANQRGREES